MKLEKNDDYKKDDHKDKYDDYKKKYDDHKDDYKMQDQDQEEARHQGRQEGGVRQGDGCQGQAGPYDRQGLPSGRAQEGVLKHEKQNLRPSWGIHAASGLCGVFFCTIGSAAVFQLRK